MSTMNRRARARPRDAELISLGARLGLITKEWLAEWAFDEKVRRGDAVDDDPERYTVGTSRLTSVPPVLGLALFISIFNSCSRSVQV